MEIDFVKGCSNTAPNKVMEKMLYRNPREIAKPQYTDEEMKFIRKMAGQVMAATAIDLLVSRRKSKRQKRR